MKEYSSVLTGLDWHTDSFDLSTYLDAVGLPQQEPSLDYLTQLIEAHLHMFPFCNLDVVLSQHPGIDPEQIQRRFLEQDRGGYCFEHVQIFAAVLEQLGFDVERRLGRVHTADNSRTHAVVIVTLDGAEYLCDPGFGFTVSTPLKLADGATASTAGQQFTLNRIERGNNVFWELTRNGKTEHIVDQLPAVPADFRTGHFITSQEPLSVFTQHLMAMGFVGEEHHTVTEKSLTTRRNGKDTEHRELTINQAAEHLSALGIHLTDDDVTGLKQKFGN